jgi:flagellar hook-associated protein 2
MATQITLGTFNQVNGKNVVTGGSSSLDTKAIIDGLVAAKRVPAVRLETANKTIDSKTTAYNELKTLFTKFQTAADTLRNPPGVDVASKNIFEYRTAALSGTGGVIPSSYLDVTVQPGAAAQGYTIGSITQLARATKQLTGNFLVADTTTASAVTANGSPVAGLFRAGTVNLRAVDGTVGGIPLTLNQGDSLQTVAGKFNEISSRTGIQATILNVNAGTYKLVFTATKTGTTYGFDLEQTLPTAGAGIASDPSNVFSEITSTTGAGQSAQNAIFSVDGVSITRETNSIADVVSNVTFNLKNSNLGGGSIVVNIKEDTTLAKNAITQFVDSYNAFRLFVSKQSELDDEGKPKDTAVLFNNSVFRTIINDVSSEVARIVAGVSSSNPSQLQDIGLKLENFDGDADNLATKNILTIDESKLNSALSSNFDGVRSLFEYRQTSNNTNFVTFKRSNNLDGVTSFSVAIDRNSNTYKATYTDPNTVSPVTVDLDYTALVGGGVSLKGQAGTVFEGAEYIYATSGNATVSLTVTQGFGDRFYNLINGYLNTENGAVTKEIENLSDSKTRNNEEITTIDDRLTKYRDQLVQQYATLESAITKANQLLQLLQAQADARNAG